MKTFKILGSVFVSYYKKFVTGRRKRKKRQPSLRLSSLILGTIMVLWQRILQNEERSLIGTPCTERQAIHTISKTNLDNLQKKLAKKGPHGSFCKKLK